MRRVHRTRFWSATAVMVIVIACLAGCAIPRAKSDDLSERGASTLAADVVLARYARERTTAESKLDNGALDSIEAGSTLLIDRSAFLISSRLGLPAQSLQLDPGATVWSPRFNAYPLWFVAVTRLASQHEQFTGLFTRASSTSPWVLDSAPRLAEDTVIPPLAFAADGTVARLVSGPPATWSDGAPMQLPEQPQVIADHYAAVLTSTSSSYADEFVNDSFITQMRQIRHAQPGSSVDFSQRWRARTVQDVLRLADGGALMFVSLKRVDSFTVSSGKALSFSGSDAAAYLPEPVHRRARLTYEHEVLMVVPGEGKPLVIGQYGGLVDATGR